MPIKTNPYAADHVDTCELCGQQRVTFRGDFSENISYIVRRQERNIDAKMCFPCTAKVFGEYTGRTALLTWWGIIGCIAGPYYIVSNIGWFSFNTFRFAFARCQKLVHPNVY